MPATTWTWANLTDDQMAKVATAEQTLGADFLLVYQPADTGATATAPELLPAALTESQLECLAGLETQLQAVVVAYSNEQASG